MSSFMQLALVTLTLLLSAVASSSSESLTLKCKYDISVYNSQEFYTCFAIGLETQHVSARFARIEGDHLENHTDFDVTALIVKNQNVSALPSRLSAFFGNLVRIEVTNSQLNHVKKENFAGLDLKTIKLRKNSIKDIEDGAFDDLENLSELNLDGSEIRGLSGKIFMKNSSLEIFSIDKNEIKTMERETFDNLPNLREFYASHNEIEEIPVDIFENSKNLKVIHMSNNKLLQIPPKIVENLTHFDFSNNTCVSGDFRSVRASDAFDEKLTFFEAFEERCGVNQSRIFNAKISEVRERLLKLFDDKKASEMPENAIENSLISQNAISSLLNDLEAEFGKKVKKIEELSGENTKVEEEKNALRSQIDELKSEKKELEDENGKLASENDELKAEAEKPKCEEEVEEIKLLREENEKLATENYDVTAERDDLMQKIEELRAKIQEASTTKSEEIDKDEYETCVKKLADTEASLNDLRDSFTNCTASENYLKTQSQETTEKINQLTRERDDLTQKYDNCNSEYLHQRFQNADLLRSTKELEEEIQNAQTKLSEAETEVSDVKRQNELFSNRLEEMSIKITYLEGIRNELMTEKENNEYELNDCKRRVVHLQQNAQSKCPICRECDEELEACSDCFNNLQIYKSTPIECEFTHIELEYSCKTSSLIVVHRHMTISEVRGHHISSYTYNSNVHRLQVIDTILQFFTNDIFAHFEFLETLEIINSQLSDVSESRIESEKIKNLRIQGNSIKEIADGAFSGVRNLEVLILTSNGIENVKQLAFTGLSELKKLILESNSIASLHMDVFSELHALTHLSVAKNQLLFLQGNLLASQRHLQLVHFNSNPISSIGSELLNYATNLQNVDFAGTCVGNFTYKGIDETKLRIKQNCRA